MVINGSCSTNMCARQLSFNFLSIVGGGHGPVAPLWIRPWWWAVFKVWTYETFTHIQQDRRLSTDDIPFDKPYKYKFKYKVGQKVIPLVQCNICNMLLQISLNDRTRGNDMKLIKSHVRYDMRRHFFTCRIVNLWNSLPATVVHASSVNNF